MSQSWQLWADAANVDESSKVFALLRTAAGDNLTSTLLGAKQALDVNVANAIDVSVAGVYDVSTNPSPDSVGSIFHTRAATPGLAEQVFRATGGVANADNVVAANVHGLDVNSFGMLFDGTAWDRQLGTAGAANVHLASFASGFALPKKGYASAVPSDVAATTTATALIATAATGRQKVYVQNQSNKPMYIGFSNAVTVKGGADPGHEVGPGGYWEEELDASVNLFAIGATGSSGNWIVREYVA